MGEHQNQSNASKNQTIRHLLKVTNDFFASQGIDSPRLDAEVLMAHVLKMERLQLYVEMDKPLNETEINLYRDVVRRRRAKEPVAYITGQREFYGLDFSVDPSVLIPRPDTETLVELALERLPAEQEGTVIDVGTGSGCIAAAIAHHRPRLNVIATDLSEDALSVASENIKQLGLQGRVSLRQGNLLEPVHDCQDVVAIVSNPPYIQKDMADTLMKDVVQFEPSLALFGMGEDGLEHHRHLLTHSLRLLAEDGFLMMEFGFGQDPLVRQLSHDGFAEPKIYADLGGIPRVVSYERFSVSS